MTEVARIGGAPGNFAVSFKPAGDKSEWDAPAKVAVDEQDLIDKGQKEDPNAGLKKYTEIDPQAKSWFGGPGYRLETCRCFSVRASRLWQD